MSKMKVKRLEMGITQEYLFLQAGVPQWRISLIERGIPPRKDEAERIAAALNTTVDELFLFGNQEPCTAGGHA